MDAMKARKLPNALAALAVLAAAVTVTAPAASAQPTKQSDTTWQVKTYLHVVNQNWLDVNVYAISGSGRYRLGTVNSFTTRDFELPRWLIATHQEVTLVTDPIGSRVANVSNTVIFTPGDVIQLTVENAINLTNAWIVGTTLAEGAEGQS
jgi:hypothetical protein